MVSLKLFFCTIFLISFITEIHYTDPEQFPEEIIVEKSLRPSQFDDFIGQKELIDNLKLYIKASNNREDALDHVLLFGPPGLGKKHIPLAQICYNSC